LPAHRVSQHDFFAILRLRGESTDPRYRALGDRVVDRDAVVGACSTLDLANDEAVVSAFVLVMAWGSGTRNSRSLRNTRSALQNPGGAASVLRESAEGLRAAERINSSELLEAHRRFSVPGVGEPFFTKWFAFAGIRVNRDWQPLILDRRVRNTLHKTLGVWLNSFADARRDAERYVGYLTALHNWGAQLPHPTLATRLEWILFEHNGKPI
jgi:hypothetical protein